MANLKEHDFVLKLNKQFVTLLTLAFLKTMYVNLKSASVIQVAEVLHAVFRNYVQYNHISRNSILSNAVSCNGLQNIQDEHTSHTFLLFWTFLKQVVKPYEESCCFFVQAWSRLLNSIFEGKL